MHKTFMARKSEVQQDWFVVDASDWVNGRLASQIAKILMGKHKPTYTPHVDTGDYVVVINCEQIQSTGKKPADKIYYRHTGYPGGIKQESLGKRLAGQFPERVLLAAVKNMLPKGPLGRSMIKKLKIYAGPDHPHQAQSIQAFPVRPTYDQEAN